MAEPKTRKTTQDPLDFIATLPKEEARRDSATLIRLMKKVTGASKARVLPARAAIAGTRNGKRPRSSGGRSWSATLRR